MAISFEEMLKRKRQHLSYSVEQRPQILQIVRAKLDWRSIAYNVSGVSRDLLCLGMLQARIDKDYTSALHSFSAGKVYARELIQLVEDGDKFPQNTLLDIEKNCDVVNNCELPIYCSLISGDIDLTTQLAQAQKTFKLTQEPRCYELTARLLGASVLDDKPLFDSLLERYSKLELLEGQDLLFDIYVKLYEAVINRDKVQYETLQKKASEDFKLRAKHKKLQDILPEYGGGRENPFVLDFMALGIAVVANQRGMVADVDTEFFPQKLFKLILERKK